MSIYAKTHYIIPPQTKAHILVITKATLPNNCNYFYTPQYYRKLAAFTYLVDANFSYIIIANYTLSLITVVCYQ